MSRCAFPFQDGEPVVTLTLITPDLTLLQPPTVRETLRVDTGFSEHLQVDWETFMALNLHRFALGLVTSILADGSTVVDTLAWVRVLIPECGIDRMMPCISNFTYGKDLLLVGGRFLKECHAVIDYPQEQTTLSG